jgi:hypothetical protein
MPKREVGSRFRGIVRVNRLLLPTPMAAFFEAEIPALRK